MWLDAAESPEFVELRSRLLRFVVPATSFLLVSIVTYATIMVWFRDLVSVRIAGMPIILLMSFVMFAITFGLTTAYNRYAKYHLDPLSSRIRDRLEERS